MSKTKKKPQRPKQQKAPSKIQTYSRTRSPLVPTEIYLENAAPLPATPCKDWLCAEGTNRAQEKSGQKYKVITFAA